MRDCYYFHGRQQARELSTLELETVINNKEKKSGITIHLVNEKYDDGQILYQASCDVLPRDTPESLANKIHRLEHAHFPRVADDYFSETLLKE